MTKASAAAAVKAAAAIKSGYPGMCLGFVRTVWGVQPRYASAKIAWAKARLRHQDPSLRSAPVGAPVFFSHPKSKYGHVALYLGNQMVRTTNSATKLIHSDPVSKWTGWGYTVLGWTGDLNGVTLPLDDPPAPVPQAKAAVKAAPVAARAPLKVSGAWDRATTRRLQEVLGVPKPDGILSSQARSKYNAGVGSAQFVAAPKGSYTVKLLQRRIGAKPDGFLGPMTITTLQKRYGTPVDGIISAPVSSMVRALQKQLNAGRV